LFFFNGENSPFLCSWLLETLVVYLCVYGLFERNVRQHLLKQVSVAQGMFTLREINWMERELCNYLDWELTVDDPILSSFEKQVN